MSLGEANETVKELVREWRRNLRGAVYENPTVNWSKFKLVDESMSAFLGEGPDE